MSAYSNDPNIPDRESQALDNETNWVDEDETNEQPKKPPLKPVKLVSHSTGKTLVMVETAFLASTSGLIWLINYYFPLGPVLRIFFPVPIALVYLRRGHRASWMAALVSSLLLSVLMGPARSIIFLIPYGLMGIQLGACWRRGTSWVISMTLGTIIGTFGLFFRFWLFSIFLGEDLWNYFLTQITELADWLFMKLGLLSEPSLGVIGLLALLMIIMSNIFYLFAVHLAALLVLDRLGNPIPRPPEWIKVILDYD
jgi:uncharacterized protein YybS (DUF2232 family)